MYTIIYIRRTMAYKTKFNPKNRSKYIGKTGNIICRSLWERSFAKYCDESKEIIKWAIEPFAIPYFDYGTQKNRKYFPDFYLEKENGMIMVVEIKPFKETHPPETAKNSKKYFIAEQTYATNMSKWKSAKALCEKKGWEFCVVTEQTLEQMGIPIIKSNAVFRRKRVGTEKRNVKYTNKPLKRK